MGILRLFWGLIITCSQAAQEDEHYHGFSHHLQCNCVAWAGRAVGQGGQAPPQLALKARWGEGTGGVATGGEVGLVEWLAGWGGWPGG